MENGNGNACGVEEDGNDSSKVCCTNDAGSTAQSALDFANTGSNSSKSSTRELPVKKLIVLSPPSRGKKWQLKEWVRTRYKMSHKRTEKRKMLSVLRRSSKHESHFFSSFSVLKKSEKGSSTLGIGGKIVKLKKSEKLDTSERSRNKRKDVEPKSGAHKRTRLDARSYLSFFRPKQSKSEVSEFMLGKREDQSQGVDNVTRAIDFEEAKDRVGEDCFSSPKRQSVDFALKHKDELSDGLCNISIAKGDCDQPSRSTSPLKYEAAVNGAEGSLLAIEDHGVELQSKLSMELAEDYVDNALHKKSYLESKTDNKDNTCAFCMLGGNLISCDGKGCARSYHLSCLNPPLNTSPHGVWHCSWCVVKKIELGVHSVSQAESIWDVREIVLDNEVMQKQKQYLVKYQGLGHVHNRWVPETELLLEASKLVAKFRRKQDIRWRTEWTVPDRLLQKRLLSFPATNDKFCHKQNNKISDCHCEWLVKWTGLGYEDATWELENASFLRSPEAKKLMMEHGNRHKRAEKMSSSCTADKGTKGAFSDLSDLSVGVSLDVHAHHLSYVNKLREYWHKSKNAVVIDDHVNQERITMAILFLLSLRLDAWRPFLIISTSAALSVWETEFSRLAPSANVVVYEGNAETRSSIRTFEFYNEGGDTMFEILLSSSDVVVKDMEELECIGWEAIVIDECQRPRISKHFKKFKMLSAKMRLLLVCGQVKDCAIDYLNLLSLLDAKFDGTETDGIKMNNSTKTSELKKRLSRYIAFEGKSSSPKFVEYWIPVQLSNVQLEQYCATLLSNSVFLCSHSKNGDSLREVVQSIKKCCDHPYLLDQALQGFVTKGLPIEKYLEVGIEASGKLQLLDKILSEIKKLSLRVVIIFQSIGGSVRESVGDILDDFVRQRFGNDSYVRIDGGGFLRSSKKQAALNMFNDKRNEKFIFLLENSACLPSIKLSAVDIVILYNSDWDPLNDMRALQKITIGSQSEQLKVLRLYSCCTVEEKILILAKEGSTLDGNIQYMNLNVCHTLLNWGASYLFNKLDDFHSRCTSNSDSNMYPEQSLLNDVLCQVTTQVLCSDEVGESRTCSIITKVQENGGGYTTNISLLGEHEVHKKDNEPAPFFWKNLLRGRHPQWKFLSGLSQRIRRKVQFYDGLSKIYDSNVDADRKKYRKVVNNVMETVHQRSRLKNKRKTAYVKKLLAGSHDNIASNGSPALQCSTNDLDSLYQEKDTSGLPPVANDIPREPCAGMIESKVGKKLHDALNSHQVLELTKSDISLLCQILQLPENVKDIAERFLEYIIKDYNVKWKKTSTLQAFQISLCWVAALILKHNIDHKESFALAKLHLNFNCKEDEADYIYSKLKRIRKKFARRSENVKGVEELSYLNALKPASDHQELEREMPRDFCYHSCLDNPTRSEQAPRYRMKEKKNSYSSNGQSGDTCGPRMKKLIQKQHKEYEEFYKVMREEKDRLEEEHRLESAIVRTTESEISVRLDKLKVLDQSFKEKMDQHNPQMEEQEENLKAMQLASRIEVEQSEPNWTGSTEETMSDNPDEHQNTVPLHNQYEYGMMQGVQSEVSEFFPSEREFYGSHLETLNIAMEPGAENHGIEVPASEITATATCVKQHAEPSESSRTALTGTDAVAFQRVADLEFTDQLSPSANAFCTADVPASIENYQSTEGCYRSSIAQHHHQSTSGHEVPDLTNTNIIPGPLNDNNPQTSAVNPEMRQHAFLDPLKVELERIQKEKEQAFQKYKDMILQLTSERDKYIEEICRRYDMLFQDAEGILVQKKIDLETRHNTVYAQKILAEALTNWYHGDKIAKPQSLELGLTVTLSHLINQFISHSPQQTVQTTSTRLRCSSSTSLNQATRPPPTSQTQLSSTGLERSLASAPLTCPQLAPANSENVPSPYIISFNPRNQCSSPSTHFTGNIQNGTELRAPAPHLRAAKLPTLRPSSSASYVPSNSNEVQIWQPPPEDLMETSSILSQPFTMPIVGSGSGTHQIEDDEHLQDAKLPTMCPSRSASYGPSKANEVQIWQPPEELMAATSGMLSEPFTIANVGSGSGTYQIEDPEHLQAAKLPTQGPSGSASYVPSKSNEVQIWQPHEDLTATSGMLSEPFTMPIVGSGSGTYKQRGC